MRWTLKFGTCLFVLCCLIATGCRDNPGKWPAEKVEGQIMRSLELVEIIQSDKNPDGFTINGKRSDGETLTITITQDPENSRMSWDAKGDRGFVEQGYHELK